MGPVTVAAQLGRRSPHSQRELSSGLRSSGAQGLEQLGRASSSAQLGVLAAHSRRSSAGARLAGRAS